MRLGQLARKLALKPVEIVGYLAKQNIMIEDGGNTKLEDDHVALILQKFAPEPAEEFHRKADVIIESPAVTHDENSPTVEVEIPTNEIIEEKEVEL